MHRILILGTTLCDPQCGKKRSSQYYNGGRHHYKHRYTVFPKYTQQPILNYLLNALLSPLSGNSTHHCRLTWIIWSYTKKNHRLCRESDRTDRRLTRYCRPLSYERQRRETCNRDSLEFGRESFQVCYSNRQNFMSVFRFSEPFDTALVCGFISKTNLSSVEVHVSGRTARD